MSRPAFGLLAAGFLLSACSQLFQPATQPPVTVAPEAPPAPAGPRHVLLLLPLTGPNAAVGQAMQNAAQLALAAPGAPPVDIVDTAGDPHQAATAAQAGVQNGDALILGPLTSDETILVAPVAQPAGVPVLAFTSDTAAASPGVWTLGLTPTQQMRRLVAAARDEGRQRLAAVLPEGAFGDALGSAFTQAASDAGMELPNIERSGDGFASFSATLKSLSGYESRRGELASRLKALRESADPDARQQAAMLSAQPVKPPPFDALLIAASGDTLHQAAEILPFYDVDQPQVRVLGPAFWGPQASHLGTLAGAWYAALNASARGEFVQAYEAKYGAPPVPLADLAVDAVAIARVLAGENDFSANALTRSEGFAGVDGAMTLLPDGQVRRALAVYQISVGGGAHVVSPAPQDLSSPGS